MSKSIALKISQIVGEIGGIDKDGENKFQNYSYISDDAIKSVLRRLMDKHHLAILPNMAKVEQQQLTTTGGKASIRVTCVFKFMLICGETGESMECDWVSEADDTSDKALNKAATAGLKYFLKSLFLIGEKDDADPDNGGEDVTPKARTEPMPRARQREDAKPATQAKPTTQKGSAFDGQIIPADAGTVMAKEVTVKVNGDRTTIWAGGIAFFTRQLFNEAGYDTAEWTKPGTYQLPEPAVIDYQTNDKGFKQAIKVS